MDLATIVGFIGSFAIVAVGILMGGPMSMFVNGASIFIVVLGSLTVVLMRSSIGDFVGAAGLAGKAFTDKIDKPEALIEKAVELATIARKDGMIALESQEVSNGFLNKGMGMLVDGQDGAAIKSTLGIEADMSIRRAKAGASIFESWGDFAPAMGMIGTLVGLVQMLANMGDPKSIGPAMAVALLTTLYGAVIANMVAFPIMQKLDQRAEADSINNELIIKALLFISEGGNPRVMEGMLYSYLSPKVRAKLEAGGG
ncbi:MAG TPA: flagellar motor protein PomA [Oceanospirillaceae bacterium]|mgnify:CR=1 FL=1|nr:flagellar motor protein PomA [Oceanospirillaceae bacterium]